MARFRGHLAQQLDAGIWNLLEDALDKDDTTPSHQPWPLSLSSPRISEPF
ncbi:hypothetical protein IMZ48_17745 [Candidatus Bathyarchaeota archaeon]|nr:hypothetical protein [Candidatus Bathyarchaeota archaeon]